MLGYLRQFQREWHTLLGERAEPDELRASRVNHNRVLAVAVAVSVVLSGGLALIVNALREGAAGILESLPGGILWVSLAALLVLALFLFWLAASRSGSPHERWTDARKGKPGR